MRIISNESFIDERGPFIICWCDDRESAELIGCNYKRLGRWVFATEGKKPVVQTCFKLWGGRANETEPADAAL